MSQSRSDRTKHQGRKEVVNYVDLTKTYNRYKDGIPLLPCKVCDSEDTVYVRDPKEKARVIESFPGEKSVDVNADYVVMFLLDGEWVHPTRCNACGSEALFENADILRFSDTVDAMLASGDARVVARTPPVE